MLGILVIAAISWLLLYFIQKEHILALGFLPVLKRLKQFGLGFLVTGMLCVLVHYLEAFLKSGEWILNGNVSASLILKSFWWDFKSVLTEELIFRGGLLYILIQRIGNWKSILISAIAFGIYHWFSYGVLGNAMAMILVFIGTGLMGYAWAWAFAKSRSIMFPFGLHLGWNFVHNTIFSKGPLGELVMILPGDQDLEGCASFLNFTSGLILVPLIVLLFVRYFVKDEKVGDLNL